MTCRGVQDGLYQSFLLFDQVQTFLKCHTSIEVAIVLHSSSFLQSVLEVIAYDPLLREEATRLYLSEEKLQKQIAHSFQPRLELEELQAQRSGSAFNPEAALKKVKEDLIVEYILTRLNLNSSYHSNAEKLKNLMNDHGHGNGWSISMIAHFHDVKDPLSGRLEALCEKPLQVTPYLLDRTLRRKERRWKLVKKLLKVSKEYRRRSSDFSVESKEEAPSPCLPPVFITPTKTSTKTIQIDENAANSVSASTVEVVSSPTDEVKDGMENNEVEKEEPSMLSNSPTGRKELPPLNITPNVVQDSERQLTSPSNRLVPLTRLTNEKIGSEHKQECKKATGNKLFGFLSIFTGHPQEQSQNVHFAEKPQVLDGTTSDDVSRRSASVSSPSGILKQTACAHILPAPIKTTSNRSPHSYHGRVSSAQRPSPCGVSQTRSTPSTPAHHQSSQRLNVSPPSARQQPRTYARLQANYYYNQNTEHQRSFRQQMQSVRSERSHHSPLSPNSSRRNQEMRCDPPVLAQVPSQEEGDDELAPPPGRKYFDTSALHDTNRKTDDCSVSSQTSYERSDSRQFLSERNVQNIQNYVSLLVKQASGFESVR
eukprot:gene1848-2025_t